MLRNKLKFIGIGAYRSGTTWFSQCLREHPDICIPYAKELEFFNRKSEEGETKYCNYDKGINWYKQQFKNCDKNASSWGEFSNAYLYDKRSSGLIKKTFPRIKLFLCLRDPVDRAYSDYLWFTLNFKREEDYDFELKSFKKSVYFERSQYSKYIKRYLDNFGRENIQVILYDDIVSRPQQVIKNAYESLVLIHLTLPLY